MRDILRCGFDELGLTLTDGMAEQYQRYFEYLEERNRVMNLTAISGKEDVARLHFLDCAALLTMAGFDGKSVIDIGSGAGFPGVPMRIAEGISLTLLDSQKKRVDFLSEVCANLSLGDVECICARAEETDRSMRESFDFAVSRAVARLNVLCELCLPFVKLGGKFIAMKGPDCAEEVDMAAGAIERLGGNDAKIMTYKVPGTDVTHAAVIIEKVGHTPEKYPRRFAKIQKTPL